MLNSPSTTLHLLVSPPSTLSKLRFKLLHRTLSHARPGARPFLFFPPWAQLQCSKHVLMGERFRNERRPPLKCSKLPLDHLPLDGREKFTCVTTSSSPWPIRGVTQTLGEQDACGVRLVPGTQPAAHRFGGMKAEVGHCPGGVTADTLQVTETAQPVSGGGPRPPELTHGLQGNLDHTARPGLQTQPHLTRPRVALPDEGRVPA